MVLLNTLCEAHFIGSFPWVQVLNGGYDTVLLLLDLLGLLIFGIGKALWRLSK